jgi:hypothetical protein
MRSDTGKKNDGYSAQQILILVTFEVKNATGHPPSTFQGLVAVTKWKFEDAKASSPSLVFH